jgi:methyltransferase (TIGR00027 family)
VTASYPSSMTALTAAAARAAHLVVDGTPPILADTLAEPLLGDRAEELIGYHRAHGAHLVLAGARAQTTGRARYTEDCLAGCVDRGTRQYVILGAGLDSFAYRSELASRLHVFEVDHPATQEDKRRRLAAAGIDPGEGVSFVPVDFERDCLTGQLADAGFDPSAPAMVSWLGVTMYLSRAAIGETLSVVGGLAPGTEVVLDYLVPEELRDADGQAYADLVAPVAAEHGEPWRSFFTPEQMSDLLREHGIEPVEQVRQQDLADAGRWPLGGALRPSNLARLARGRVSGGSAPGKPQRRR